MWKRYWDSDWRDPVTFCCQCRCQENLLLGVGQAVKPGEGTSPNCHVVRRERLPLLPRGGPAWRTLALESPCLNDCHMSSLSG